MNGGTKFHVYVHMASGSSVHGDKPVIDVDVVPILAFEHRSLGQTVHDRVRHEHLSVKHVLTQQSGNVRGDDVQVDDDIGRARRCPERDADSSKRLECRVGETKSPMRLGDSSGVRPASGQYAV